MSKGKMFQQSLGDW